MATDTNPEKAQHFIAGIVGDPARQSWFERYDVPTLLVALAIYTSWALLILFHEQIPWWMLAPAAGYVVQWHFSLQHEAIHAMRGLPKWLRRAIVWAPIGGWFPYELYRRSHSQHHRNRHITYPGEDTETFYHKDADWRAYSGPWRWLLIANQTFAGRLLIGPFLRTPRVYIKEFQKISAGDTSNVGIWIRHFVGVGAILIVASRAFDLPAWQYVVEFVYPGLVFGMMRSFTEHRWGARPNERTAIVESNWVFGLMFLWNNLHAVHHVFPTLAWWRLPRVWREHRAAIEAHNGGFVFPGYGYIARRWLFAPNFIPVHPRTVEPRTNEA